jgi:hypothetical protein
MIAYREKNLARSVRSCYETADSPENLYFSVVAEQSIKSLHDDLSFIPPNQITYRKYDLSRYRGVLWSRSKTTEVSFDYDYILYTCGHNLFVPGWDTLVLKEYKKAATKAEKALITVTGPSFHYESSETIVQDAQINLYRPSLPASYVPGYGFPKQIEVPVSEGLFEDTYIQFSWVFAPKKYVEEVPLDPDMNYHGEEIYATIQSWCRGWRFFSTSKIFYYHDTHKEYPGEDQPRMTTHRPWSDINKDAFWEQSDRSMVKLNSLLSGNLAGKYGDISKKEVLEYCNFSGLNKTWCENNSEYDKLKYRRHAEDFRHRPPLPIESKNYAL